MSVAAVARRIAASRAVAERVDAKQAEAARVMGWGVPTSRYTVSPRWSHGIARGIA